MRHCLIAVLLLAACAHTEPTPTGPYRETTPFAPGPEALLVPRDGGSWTENGGGILYQGRCLSRAPSLNRHRTPPDTGIIGSMEHIPASGGSVSWEQCEERSQYALGTDSTETFPAMAMGSDGRLVYMELIGDIPRPGRPTHFPSGFHGDLWLADSAHPFSVRRRLLTMFQGDAGAPLAGPINFLNGGAWVGPTTFVARGSNLQGDGHQQDLGLVRGVIATDTTTLKIIPGTAVARSWSAAQSGTTLVFNVDSLTLARTPVAGGTIAPFAAIPSGGHRNIVDVSCAGDLCLILTREDASFPLRGSTFWTVSLSSGAVTMLRHDLAEYNSAKLSPQGRLVLVGEGDGMHLFSALVN